MPAFAIGQVPAEQLNFNAGLELGVPISFRLDNHAEPLQNGIRPPYGVDVNVGVLASTPTTPPSDLHFAIDDDTAVAQVPIKVRSDLV